MITQGNEYDIIGILNKYPRAREKFNNWFLDRLRPIQKGIWKEAGLDVTDFDVKFDENKETHLSGIEPYFKYNGRNLYEFFDEEGIFIEGYEYNGKFGADVQGNEINGFERRWDMEKASFDMAFGLLEGKF